MEKLIVNNDGTFQNSNGQQFIPDSYIIPGDIVDGMDKNGDAKKYYRKGLKDQELINETYEVLLYGEELTDEEKSYLTSQGVAYGNEYLKNQGFEL